MEVSNIFIRILTFKFVFINFCGVCVKLCYVLVMRGWNRVIICAWTTSSLDGLVLRLCFLVYCLACYIPVSPVYHHHVVLIVSRHPSL